MDSMVQERTDSATFWWNFEMNSEVKNDKIQKQFQIPFIS